MAASEGRLPRILVICDYYLPGYKSGGGMRTVVNMVDRLSHRFEFLVLTRDHDGKGDLTPYPGVSYETWSNVSGAHVRYMRRGGAGFRAIGAALREAEPDCIYLNSVFSPLTFKTLLRRRLVSDKDIPILVAPEGELSSGALAIKSLKKRLYLEVVRVLGLFDEILWKVTNEGEANEVSSLFTKARIHIAPNVSAKNDRQQDRGKDRVKQAGSLRAIYLSRVTPKKNLHWFLQLLRVADQGYSLDVFGDSDDDAYLAKCRMLAEGMAVNFKGPLAHEKVVETLAQYDVFVLPTLNENYGHVVLEALSAGTPVLISDSTPWTDSVNLGAGRALPLDEARWLSALQEMRETDEDEYAALRESAMRLAERVLHSGEDVRKTADVLESALRSES